MHACECVYAQSLPQNIYQGNAVIGWWKERKEKNWNEALTAAREERETNSIIIIMIMFLFPGNWEIYIICECIRMNYSQSY